MRTRNKAAKAITKTGTAPKPPAADGCQLADETIQKLALAVARALRRVLRLDMPIYARITAADTIHTAEKPATVFRHAINEARLAKSELEQMEAQAATQERTATR